MHCTHWRQLSTRATMSSENISGRRAGLGLHGAVRARLAPLDGDAVDHEAHLTLSRRIQRHDGGHASAFGGEPGSIFKMGEVDGRGGRQGRGRWGEPAAELRRKRMRKARGRRCPW